MFYKIIGFFFLPLMLLALLLSLVGVQQISFDETYYNFMNSVAQTSASWSFEIPKIPSINMIDNQSWGDVVGSFDNVTDILSFFSAIGTFFTWFGQFFVVLINGLISVLNILITIVNVLISLIQLILSFIYTIFDFRDNLVQVALVM